MDISYYKKMEPFWGVWRIKKLLGEGSFGKVFEIEREDFGRVYKAALKVITIPQSESELKSVLADGLDAQNVTDYYRSFVMEVVEEFALMADFKGNTNIVSYEDHMVVEHQDSFGWNILIRMELLTPLLEYTSAEHPMGRGQVIKLGADMCRALEYCRKQNVIHRDIKPENIFVSKSGDFKLGDFGIARTAEKTMSGLSRKGTFSYMAPEVYKGEEYGASVDIYSLGIVLYRLLNRNRTPFLPVYPKPITHSDRENAIAKRIAGQQMPLPVDAQDELGEIILKACAFRPQDRYSSPEQMRMELEAVEEDGTEILAAEPVEKGETAIPAAASVEEKTRILFPDLPKEEIVQPGPEIQKEAAVQQVDVLLQDASKVEEKEKSARKPLVAAAVVIAVLGTVGIVFGNAGDKRYEMASSGGVLNEETDVSQEDDVEDMTGEDESLAVGAEKASDETEELSDTETESEVEQQAEPETITFVDYDGEEYTLEVNPNVPRHGYNTEAFVREGDKMTYMDSAQGSSFLGVDVSSYTGKIDWNQVKAAGYDFAFIRLGYRGYGPKGGMYADSEFINNFSNAMEAGMHIGVYFESYAINEQEAEKEAQFVFDGLNAAGYDFYEYEYLPIAYVLGRDRGTRSRTKDLTKEQFTKNAKAFCQKIDETRFQPIVYANLYREAYQLDLEALSDYPIWYSDYYAGQHSSIPQTPYHFAVWQYDAVSIDGIDGYVDVNIQLTDWDLKEEIVE